MNKINIITISDGNINELLRTLKSIDSQSCKQYFNIIITKKILNISRSFHSSKRKFFKDSKGSIYSAMNKGLSECKTGSIMFLNAGDTFYSNQSLRKIKILTNNFNNNFCLMLISLLKNENNLYRPRKKQFYLKNFFTHNSFIAPLKSKQFNFNIKNKITADGFWMKKCVDKFGIKKIYQPMTIFYLGGISNTPSIKTIKMKINDGYLSIAKEILKLILIKIVNKNNFYNIIYLFKYSRFNFVRK